MTGQSIAKRPVIFTWAELQKYPTLEARYAETLPFQGCHRYPCDFCCHSSLTRKCECECNSCVQRKENRAKCIKRTAERWAWFSAARDLDDKRGERLGTLGYLPWEIRQQIFESLLQSTSWYWPDIKIVQMSDYESSDLTRWGYHNIGLASPSTKVDFEHCYLTKTIFAFDQPTSLESFLDSLSIYQQNLLRSFEFNFCGWDSWYQTEMRSWLRICNRLPSNLRSIKFDLRHVVSSIKEPGEKWFIRDEYLWLPKFKLYIELMNTLGKRAQRRAARAKIGLVEGRYGREYLERDEKQWFPVLDELEPWSESWLEWWEKDTKVEFDEGEEASNKAWVLGEKPLA